MKKGMEFIKELRKTSKGRAILFFGFYFFFFLAIAIIARSTPRNETPMQEEAVEVFPIQSYLESNYQFSYSILENQIEVIYQGTRLDARSSIKKGEEEYFEENGEFYAKKETWEKIDNPYLYPEFFKEENISLLLSNSMKESTTEYESGSVLYQFLISTNTINQLFYEKDTDIEEIPNRISIRIDEKGKLSSITYYLDSYCAQLDTCESTLKITLYYQNMGEIDSLQKPF